MKRTCLLPLLAAVAAASAPARAASAEPAAEPYGRHLVTNALVIDMAGAPVKDQRQSSTAPDLGYAGALTEGYGDCAWFYDPAHADATWKLFREAGAHVLKQWDSVMTWQKGRHESKAGNPNPKWCFDFWKKHGVKVLLTLEHHKVFEDAACTKKTDDLETVKRTILDYVRWIVDNGYQDVVGGFELGNEPYWGSDPEGYAARWVAIVPGIKRIFPEAKIGMPLAEYRAGDPDIAAVRARATGLEWVQGGGEFSFSKLNQWSGRFIVAMKPVLDDITHVIYHFYGADRAYGCSQSGYNRIHNFAKVFPEIADKRVWITEWRERADEDLRCHQRFFSTLWKGHYMLGVLMQPEIDGISLHNLATLSGGLYVTTDKGTWCVQRGANDREYPYVGDSKDPVMEVGPAGPVFRLFTEALMDHPIVVEHVVPGGQPGEIVHGKGTHGQWHGIWGGTLFYETGLRAQKAADAGTPPDQWPAIDSLWECVVALSANRDSAALLLVNSHPYEDEIPVTLVNGASFAGEAVIRSASVEKAHLFECQVPGTPHLWTESVTKENVAGKTSFTVRLPPYSIQTVVVGVKN